MGKENNNNDNKRGKSFQIPIIVNNPPIIVHEKNIKNRQGKKGYQGNNGEPGAKGEPGIPAVSTITSVNNLTNSECTADACTEQLIDALNQLIDSGVFTSNANFGLENGRTISGIPESIDDYGIIRLETRGKILLPKLISVKYQV